MSENSFFFPPNQFVVQRHSLFQGNLLLTIKPHYQTFPRHIPPSLFNVHEMAPNLITDFMAFLGGSHAPIPWTPFSTGDGLTLHLSTTGNVFST